MARPQRHDERGAWHHLINRGADRQDIYSSNHDRLVFEYHLADLDHRGLLEIHAYVLMDNHYHLLARSPSGQLSDAMHRLGSEYARWYNNEHRRDGPLFRNRFVSIPITNSEQLLVESRYLHRNPLAFVSLRALPAYRWSSLGAYLGHRPTPDWLHREVLDGLIGGVGNHLDFIEQSHPSDADHTRWADLRPTVDLCAIEVAVRRATRTDVWPVAGLPSRRTDTFALVLLLAVELRAATAEQLAVQYGVPSASAVRTAARRGRVRLVDDPDFANLRTQVLATLFSRAA